MKHIDYGRSLVLQLLYSGSSLCLEESKKLSWLHTLPEDSPPSGSPSLITQNELGWGDRPGKSLSQVRQAGVGRSTCRPVGSRSTPAWEGTVLACPGLYLRLWERACVYRHVLIH